MFRGSLNLRLAVDESDKQIEVHSGNSASSLTVDYHGDELSTGRPHSPAQRRRALAGLVLAASCFLAMLVVLLIVGRWKSTNILYSLIPILKMIAALVVAVSLGASAVLVHRTTWKVIYCNLAAIALAFSVTFGYIAYRQPRDKVFELVEPKRWNRLDPIVGYMPLPNGTFRFTKFAGSQKLYDVKASTDAFGWRITPPAPSATRSLLFFGCSFTFGVGLNDEESIPYRVAVKTGGRYAVYNFGQGGWGPNQMLALLEHNLTDPVVKQPPELAVFLTIPDHMGRIKGVTPFSDGFPRYVLNSSGQAVAAGTFSGTLGPVDRALRDLNIGGWVRNLGLPSWRPFKGDSDQLYFAIMRSARDQIQHRYPGCRFEVVLWGASDRWVSEDWSRRMEAGLRAEGIPVHRAEEFLPGVGSNPDRYRISPLEHHPNALAADSMADYVVHRMLAK
jgi:hypothetical protein